MGECTRILGQSRVVLMDVLKLCPFCGGEAKVYGDNNTAPEVWIMCDKCKASTSAHTCRQPAIEAWNTRYDPHIDAIPATEENRARYGWVRERTCTMERDEWYPCAEDDCKRLHMPRWFCSECENDMVGALPDYCPNCGAKVTNYERNIQ